MALPVYYLTGMGGQLSKGLGQALLSRNVDVTGRELVGDFRNRSFQEQIDTVIDDLRTHFWQQDARVVANSFGAYLFLHAQAELDPYVGKVLLLSPIVGEFSNQETRMNFLPPRAHKLFELANSNGFAAPINCQIHVGEEDWQSDPRSVQTFGNLVGLNVTIVKGAGHLLPKNYVGNLLDDWL